MQQPQGAQPLFDASSNAGNAARGAGTPAAQEAWGPAAAQPAAAATANGGCSGAADSSGGGGFSRTFAGMPDVSDVDVLSVLFCLCPDLLDEMLEVGAEAWVRGRKGARSEATAAHGLHRPPQLSHVP